MIIPFIDAFRMDITVADTLFPCALKPCFCVLQTNETEIHWMAFYMFNEEVFIYVLFLYDFVFRVLTSPRLDKKYCRGQGGHIFNLNHNFLSYS